MERLLFFSNVSNVAEKQQGAGPVRDFPEK